MDESVGVHAGASGEAGRVRGGLTEPWTAVGDACLLGWTAGPDRTRGRAS
jgi:hypothetical protein